MHRPALSVALLAVALSSAARADRGYWEDLALRSAEVRPESLFEELPDIGACREGAMQKAEPAKALRTLNAIRELHRLPPVRLDVLSQALPAKASLMMVANNLMTHTPQRTSRCGSTEGVTGSGESNLYFGNISGTVPSSETLVVGWLKDLDVPGLGHRRWVLDPFLGPVSFARVDDPKTKRFGAAMRVFGRRESPPELGALELVAYPYERYPAMLFDPRAEWSVSIVDGARSRGEVKHGYFDQAAVRVRDVETRRTLDVSRLTRDTKNIGLPNFLSWRVAGVQPGSWYEVTIENVRNRDGSERTLAWKVFIDGAAPRRTISAGGVTWERKTAQNTADTFTLGEAKRYCAGLGGRVPTLEELQAVIAPGRAFAVDLDQFPNITDQANYWTSSEWQPGRGFVNVVAFWDGGKVYQQQPGETGAVLCALNRPK